MGKKTIVVFGAALLLLADGVLSTSLADPPWDVGNGTIFAPIEKTKRDISLDLIAQGAGLNGGPTLTAPLKGVVAPGLPDTLFIVDQPGQIWAIDLNAPRPVTCPGAGCTLFFDVKANLPAPGLVVLGCVPAQTTSFGGSFDERGLLGLAFHPDFGTNGENRFYTYTSEQNSGTPTFPTTILAGKVDHQNVIREWPSNRELMRVDWPQFNHDGGDVAFGPDDDLLYISMGDGGGADDRDGQDFIDCGSDPSMNLAMVGHGTTGNGQKLTNPLGKILRIDVDGSNSANGQYGIPADNPFVGSSPFDCSDGFCDEIFAYGLRNPYRFSFDTKTSDLYVGNVGQNDLEEVELVTSGDNLGWNFKEGTFSFNTGFPTPNDLGFACDPAAGPMPCPSAPPNLVDPLAQYDTHHEGHAVIGGFVYRGSELKQLKGRYIFGDFSVIFRFPIGPQDHGRLFHLDPGGKKGKKGGKGLRKIEEFQIVPSNRLSMALLGWGQDADGELYPMGNNSGLPFFGEGVVLKMVPAVEPFPPLRQ